MIDPDSPWFGKCLAHQYLKESYFDGFRIRSDAINSVRPDRVLPILAEEQVFGARMLQKILRPAGRRQFFLDVGTGSGIFAIIAAKLGYKVVAIDISPRSIRVARGNAIKNGISVVRDFSGNSEGFSDDSEGEIKFLCSDARDFDFAEKVPMCISQSAIQPYRSIFLSGFA